MKIDANQYAKWKAAGRVSFVAVNGSVYVQLSSIDPVTQEATSVNLYQCDTDVLASDIAATQATLANQQTLQTDQAAFNNQPPA